MTDVIIDDNELDDGKPSYHHSIYVWNIAAFARQQVSSSLLAYHSSPVRPYTTTRPTFLGKDLTY